MKKYAIVSATVLFVFAVVVFVSAGEVSWQDMSAGISGVNSVLIHPVDPRIIYTATDKGVFLSRDSGANWRNVLFTRGSSRRVNQLSFYPGDDDKLYAATENGFFYSPDRGKNWKRIFRGKNYLENACVAAIVLPSGIFLGTRAGLFISKDNGKSWYKRGADLGKSNILAIACGRKDPATIYVVCARGLYISRDAGLSWKRVFLSRLGSDAQSEEEPEDDEGGSDSDYPGHCAVESDRQGNIYLAISARLYKSQDQGVSWDLFAGYGLIGGDIRFLLAGGSSDLYAATKSGVFRFEGLRWQELSLGLYAGEVNSLALDSPGNLYAACARGLFKMMPVAVGQKEGKDLFSIYARGEPEINEVQQAAIEYAEVGSLKIKRWRKQAAKRAFLPKVTLDADWDLDRTTSHAIWGTYYSSTLPDRFFRGPDDVTKYNNKNWGISLSWELGDLIYSDDQTNIDVRSRLMVELRDDILDEVTKIYFERIRMKAELDSFSIEDRKKIFSAELKIRELTASLDALTGGYFSRNIQKNILD